MITVQMDLHMEKSMLHEKKITDWLILEDDSLALLPHPERNIVQYFVAEGGARVALLRAGSSKYRVVDFDRHKRATKDKHVIAFLSVNVNFSVKNVVL